MSYTSAYTSWNRLLAFRRPPLVTTPDTNVPRTATAMEQNGGAITINMAPADSAATNNKEKKTPESLFGPNIGVVSSGPAWTTVNEKKVLADELTQDVVRSWVQKSKEASQPTTTLQALVNLKRPTLRLSPLAPAEENDSHHHHGLEFEYDCDAPRCGIYVHVLLPSDHPDAPAASSVNGLSKLLVFETVVDGGFGRVLKLDEGAMLELDRFEHGRTATEATSSSAAALPTPAPNSDMSSAAPDAGATLPSASNRQSRRRFTHFHFRKRANPANRSVTGPALAVVDAEPSAATANENGSAEKKDDSDADGVRVTIRLAALDEQGTELASPNEQVTYLHVVRFGVKSTSTAEGEDEPEDARPWVVKVVKREATIGPHTFHLHEIYGLTSSSSHNPAPTAPLPDSHTYPPNNADQTAVQPATAEDEPSSECLLCLSSPREVVLLPCRHLVACKECALNMVEFGAGGTITQSEDPATAAPAAGEEPAANGEGAANVEAGATDAAAAAPAATPQTPANPAITPTTRRKRKAKGWFCPVCRQPYTSLLRITTNPPPPPSETSKESSAEAGETTTSPITNALPENVPSRSNGRLLSTGFRPAFLRTLSRSTPQGDLESQMGTTARVGV